MRVSIDCRYVRERPSGIGAYVEALVRRIPRLAPADAFHLWVSEKARRPLSPAPNVSETVVGAEANGPATTLWPARLVDLCGVDVLHEPFNILGRGIRCATVVTVHDLIWIDEPLAAEGLSWMTPLQVAFYRDGIGRALRRATRVIAISHATAAAVMRRRPDVAPRLRVVPHGVEIERFRPGDAAAARARAAALLGTDDPFFLVVGQNAPYKNHDGALAGFAAAELGPRVRLVLLQRLSPGGRIARRAAELGLGDRVLWRTGLGDDDVRALLHACLALVQYSRFEGFGMPVAEAMAAGAPVVASDIAPLVEVLAGAGLTVPLDPAQLGRALRRVATEPALRAELSARGSARAAELSWDRSAEQHLDVYREAAEAGPLP